MSISINTIKTCTDIPGCMTAEEIWLVTIDDEHLCKLPNYVLHRWLSTKAEMQKELLPY